jgi:NAD(P)-dependent dehydrogenase (short-subunit alcohol dehydrogenase family)
MVRARGRDQVLGMTYDDRTPAPRARQRTTLVTGATDGIGRAVAIELARNGDRLFLVGRDEARAHTLLEELRQVSRLEHTFLRTDLSLLEDTARLAGEVERRAKRLDAIVCCAGVLSLVPEWTAEGLERNFVLSYLSRYLLVRRLTKMLSAGPSGRIVLVANAGVYRDTIDFDDLQHRRGKPGLAVSSRAQFANDLFTTELAERLRDTRIEATCVFPGAVRTKVFENARGLPWFAKLVVPVVGLFAQRPAAAAATPVYLAQSPDAVNVSGRFFGPKRKPRRVPARALRGDRRAELWEASDALVRRYLERPIERSMTA